MAWGIAGIIALMILLLAAWVAFLLCMCSMDKTSDWHKEM